MMADTRAAGRVPVSDNERLEVRARMGFTVTNFLVVLIAAALPLLAALWLFNRKAY
jgi:hypothetical protein